MSTSTGRLRLLHGVETPLPELRELRAGPVSLVLDGIDLRYLRVGHTELVRRIYAAVRDSDWDTVPAVVSGFELHEEARSFRLEFDARHVRREIDFAWHGMITGDGSGRVEFVFEGRAKSTFPYNRIGICFHQPWRETAGASFAARTASGELEGVFPDLIGVQRLGGGTFHPLFPAFDRLEVELPSGGRLRFELEGDLWETEDHRNWTDANFKTYSTPLALGRPAPLEVGQTLSQRLVVTPVDVPDAAPEQGPTRLTIGPPTGTTVPAVGLSADRDRHPLDEHEIGVLSELAPSHLRVEVRLDRDDWRSTLEAAQEAARATRSHLEVVLHLVAAHAPALPAVVALLDGGTPVDRVLVVNADSRTGTPTETTRAELVDLVREAFAGPLSGVPLVGGTEIYFTEINRTRPELASWDGLCYSLSPQIHAFGDVDLVENLDAQAETVRSARVIAGDKPVIVSPVTLRRRVNFHAEGEPPPDPPGELPDSVDPRQSTLLGAAWTVGSLKYLAEAGAASVTYFETTGWRGVVARAGGSELPARFRSQPGEAFPLYHALADAAEWRGAEVLVLDSGDLLAAVGLVVRAEGGGVRALVANVTPLEREIMIGPLEGAVSLRRLNERTAPEAAADPSSFRRRSETAFARGELTLRLAPYEVVRIDPT